jgi:gas vesicle protein
MKHSRLLLVTMLSGALLVGACAKKDESPLDRAVDKTKDALDARDHEAIKDAAEDMKDAAKDLGSAAKDAAKDMGDAAKDMAKDTATAAKDAAADVKDAVKKD